MVLKIVIKRKCIIFQIIGILQLLLLSKQFKKMIQRIQTLYFIAIILICGMACGGSLVNYLVSTPGLVTEYILNLIYFTTKENGNVISQKLNFELIALASLLIGWNINIILGFKNRKRQILYTKLNFIIIGITIAVLFIKAYTVIPNFAFSTLSMQSTFGLALLFFMLYLNLRGLLLIRKDEALVKSADRIR